MRFHQALLNTEVTSETRELRNLNIFMLPFPTVYKCIERCNAFFVFGLKGSLLIDLQNNAFSLLVFTSKAFYLCQGVESSLLNWWHPSVSICVQKDVKKKKTHIKFCSNCSVFLQETRWNAITMPGCHGKWMLKTEHRDCTCDPNSEMSFILLWATFSTRKLFLS